MLWLEVLEIVLVLGSEAQISQTTQICPKKNFSCPANFKIAKLLNHQSYLGVQITDGNKRNLSTSSMLISMPKISFWHLAGRFEHNHFLWCFHSILWCSPCIRDCPFHRMVSVHLLESVIQFSSTLMRLCRVSMHILKSPYTTGLVGDAS
jgi:hypothetical protein